MTCEHLNFSASVSVGRVTASESDETVVRHTVEITVSCAACGHPMEFQGLPVGIDTHGPTMSPDGLEARLVAMPKGEEMLASGRIAAIFRAEGQA